MIIKVFHVRADYVGTVAGNYRSVREILPVTNIT